MGYFYQQLLISLIVVSIVWGCKPTSVSDHSAVSIFPKNGPTTSSLSFEILKNEGGGREFKIVKVNLDSNKTELKVYQCVSPRYLRG